MSSLGDGAAGNTPGDYVQYAERYSQSASFSVGSLGGKRYHPAREEQTVVSCEFQFSVWHSLRSEACHLASLV
jgi:hypothetical protein